MRKIKISINIHIEPDGDMFHAYCPTLKGLHVDGATVDEAAERAREAVDVYIKSLLSHGDPIPTSCEIVPQRSILDAIKSRLRKAVPVTVVPTEVCLAA